jgi:hypothetical protein
VGSCPLSTVRDLIEFFFSSPFYWDHKVMTSINDDAKGTTKQPARSARRHFYYWELCKIPLQMLRPRIYHRVPFDSSSNPLSLVASLVRGSKRTSTSKIGRASSYAARAIVHAVYRITIDERHTI